MKREKINKIKKCNENVLKEKRLNKKRGSELVQTVLITAIMIVIVATLFYPGIKGIFNSSMGKLEDWYDGVMTKMAPTAYM